MAVSDWAQKKVTATLSIVEDPAFDHVLQSTTPMHADGEGYLLYNGKTDFLNSEVKAHIKRVTYSVWDKTEHCFIFRSDGNLDNAYVAEIALPGGGSHQLIGRIKKYDAGVKSTLLTSGNLRLKSDVWELWRIRCWDVVFPGTAVRFTFEYWDGANWILEWQIDEITMFLLGVSGRSGIGTCANNSSAAFTARINDVDLGHMV